MVTLYLPIVSTSLLLTLAASPVPMAGQANAQKMLAISGCADSVKDSAASGACLTASSVPTLGTLYPLSSALYVTPTDDIGIGTTAPALGVDVHVVRNLGEALLRLTTNAVHGHVAGVQVQASGTGWTIGTGADDFGGVGGLGFRTFPGSTTMVMKPDGKVGMGTTDPLVALHVVRNSSATAEIRMTSTGPYGEAAGLSVAHAATNTGWSIATGSNDFGGVGGLGFRRFGGPTVVVVQAGGNVGIGTMSPTARLDVAGETATNTLRIRGGSDVVERFVSSSGALQPGSVVALDPDFAGKVMASSGVYDKKVIGVVSGAGGVNSGIELSQDGVLDGDVQVAMVGRVYVKCSAENGPIGPGDRLTTASLDGHAMKVTDSSLADGAVIGKAASALRDGTGLVLVVINLQ